MTAFIVTTQSYFNNQSASLEIYQLHNYIPYIYINFIK